MIIDQLEGINTQYKEEPSVGQGVLDYLDPSTSLGTEDLSANVKWSQHYMERIATAHTFAYHNAADGDMGSHYTNVMEDLGKQESPLQARYLREVMSYAEQGRLDDTEELAGAPLLEGESPDLRLTSVLDKQIADAENPPNISEALVDRPPTKPGEDSKEAIDNFRSVTNTAQLRTELMSSIQAGVDDSYLAQFASVFTDMVLPGQNNTYLMDLRKMLDPEFAEKGLLKQINFTANHRAALIEYFNTLSPDDYRKKAKQIIEAVHKAESFIGSSNNSDKAFLIEDILSSTEVSDLQGGIDSLVDILDTALSVSLAGVAWKTGKRITTAIGRAFGSTANAVKTSVKFSEDVTMMAIDTAIFDTPKPSSAVGLENLTGNATGATGVAIAASANGVPSLARALSEGNNITIWNLGPKQGGSSNLKLGHPIDAPDPNLVREYNRVAAVKLSEGEIEERVVKEAKILNELNGIKMLDNMSEMHVAEKNNNFGIRAMYTNGDGTAWNTIEDMTASMIDAGIQKDSIVYMYKKNPKTGQYEYIGDPSSINPKTRGTYLFQLDNYYQFNPKDGDLWDADKIDMSWMVSAAGHRARWLLDVDSRYNKFLSGAMHRMSDGKDALTAQAFEPIKQTYFKLPKQSQVKVNGVIEEGHKHEMRFTADELRLKGLDEKEREAYYKVRQLWDTHWIIDNNDMIRRFDGRGLELFKVNGPRKAVPELRHTYVKPYKTNPDNLESGAVYIDPLTGATKVVGSKGSRQLEIYDQGMYLAKLDVPHKITDTKSVDYILVDPRATTQRRLQQTDAILDYKKGYVRRYYDTHYFIRNKKRDETVAATNSSGRAARAVAKLGDDYEMMPSRIDTLIEGSYIDSIHPVTPIRTSQRKRGEHLKDISFEGHLHGEAQTLDPNMALTRATQQIGSLAVQHGEMQLMKQRWLKTFAHLLPNDKKGVWPDKIEDIQLVNLDRATQNKAREMYDYINHLEGQAAMDATQRWARSGIIKLAELIEKGGPSRFKETTAKLVQNVGEVPLVGTAITNPVQLIRAVPYTMFLVLNPARQLLVQSSQLLQMGILDPTNFIRIPVAGGAMFLGNGMRRYFSNKSHSKVLRDKVKANYNQLVKAQSDMLGISVKDYIKLEKNFYERSGLPQSIDHNIIVNGVASTRVSMLRDHPMLSWGKAAARFPVVAARKVGFDFGEQANLLGTYIAAYSRMKKADPKLKLDDKTLERLSADARSLSLGMNQAGKFSYNDGIPGVITQFFAVPHKMATTMLGANKAFTPKEKAKLFAANTFLFGGAAVGADQYLEELRLQNELWQPLQNLSEGDWETIKLGILNTALNRAYEGIVGETTTNINFSGSIAAAGGITMMVDRLTDLMDGQHAAALGPGVHYLFSEKGKLRTTYNDIVSLSSVGERVEDINTMSMAGRFLSKLSSGTNNWAKAKFIRDMGLMENSRALGTATDQERTWADSWAYAMGFQQEADSDIWAYRMSEKDRKAGIKESAKEFVKQWGMITATRNTDASYQEEYYDRMKEAIAFAAHVADDERNRADFFEEVERELKLTDLNKNPIYNIIKYVYENKDPYEFTINYIKTHNGIRSEHKQALIEFTESQRIYKIEEDDK